MMISGYDCWKRKGLSRCRKLDSVGAETTSSGSPFQIRGPETLNVQLPTVDDRNIGITRRMELAERSARRPCRSASRSSRHRAAMKCNSTGPAHPERSATMSRTWRSACSYASFTRYRSNRSNRMWQAVNTCSVANSLLCVAAKN